jgi:uncharacterized protein (TIGR03067 family)
MFNYISVLAVAVLALVSSDPLPAGDAKANDAVKDELKKLSGMWTFIEGELDGKTSTPADLNWKNCEAAITGDAYTVFIDGRVVLTGTFTVDPSQTPKTIDLDITRPIVAHYRGIYEVDKDHLKFCMSPPNGERPTAFSSPPGSHWWLSKYKRKKPRLTPSPKPGREGPADVQPLLRYRRCRACPRLFRHASPGQCQVQRRDQGRVEEALRGLGVCRCRAGREDVHRRRSQPETM